MLLVATPLHLSVFDTVSGRLRLLRKGDGEYYGVSWNRDHLVVSHSNQDNETLATHADYRDARRGYLSLCARDSDPSRGTACLLQPHQIECVGDQIIAANTGLNGLSVFSASGELIRHVHLNEVTWDRSEDGSSGNHFNSVHRQGNRLYVLAHNHDRPSAVWELSWPELEVLEIHETRASWAHNIWAGEHGLVVCDSKHGGLVSVETGETIWRADEPRVITRGLAAVGNLLYIGRSEYGSRGDRKRNDGGLWIVDRKTLRTLERHVFPGSGCVNELRGLSGQDDCHVEAPFDPAWLTRLAHCPLRERLSHTWSWARRAALVRRSGTPSPRRA
ncbi:MAG TPA: hypothetical protein VFT46_07655 [Holophagaceae bacterium]|nr:hypothetical protein [Holophagaceae bacterium]